MDVRDPRPPQFQETAPAAAAPSEPAYLRADTDLAKLDEWFTYHAPTGDQPVRYQAIREASRQLAETIIRACPPSADRSAALRKVREAMMTANASIALGGL